MPTGRGLLPLADVPDRERSDGFSQPMIRGEHAVVAMPMLPRRRDEIGQPAGERLAIQLHLGMIQYEAAFIDGKPYVATVGEIAENEDNMDDEIGFPDETGFFGLGIWLDGDRLGLEPICVSGDFNGNICVTRATFPISLANRAVVYLQKLGAGSSSAGS